ncbi:MAG: hypothetical protein UH685_00515, partial [Bacteroidaceae bacterium]|nr:hypothetical protein [Bacteroidaceae bacterium]
MNFAGRTRAVFRRHKLGCNISRVKVQEKQWECAGMAHSHALCCLRLIPVRCYRAREHQSAFTRCLGEKDIAVVCGIDRDVELDVASQNL